MSTVKTTYPQIEDFYGLSTWFELAQGDEALLVRILADTAGLKGWLSRPQHDQLSSALLVDVEHAGELQSFDRAAVYLLSQMPRFIGPIDEASWLQWLKQWQVIHKDKTPAEQLDALPDRFDLHHAEPIMAQLLANQKEKIIPLTIKS
ncbi:hypothetical protein [Oceanospirillum linum]|uniref:Uncharacterized protein n=1 Tax=Oceanospirillum linum TaxID=966 RepID=A0A1T1HGA7_OCELI|nr:hypothetical protein [Oceanospirillum linum]OOV88842.1 hypothetical protein BTA35_0205075 [Oceanospirillum linum]SEG49695.1 hypothetical protein SAMN04489856_11329 [Oleiphilus messinensis]SMP22829.1 hypothetical protein SAMN06264348_104291 [Oceanospirillum linum]